MMSDEHTIHPGQSERVDGRDAPWPLRPWIMALICAVAANIVYNLTSSGGTISDFTACSAIFCAIAALSFVLTVEQRRWTWSLAFALGWGVVIALVGLSSRGYNQVATIFEWPFFSGLFAVIIAAPLFQGARDEGAWRFPPQSVHTHAWTDAVLGAAALLFVGISIAMAWLIAGLFDLIGIAFLKELLNTGWATVTLAGFAFGAGVGILRERDALVATMQRLVMVVLSVLSPILAGALVLFLLSLPLTGLSGLWDGWLSATALTLVAAGGAYLLINAAIGHGDEARPVHPLLLRSALVLALVVAPLAALALFAMLIRTHQYGWTPERIWGVLCCVIALCYGLAGWWAVAKGRMDYPAILRVLQVRLALGVCALALFLSLPIVDFGSISASNQLARLNSGQVTAEKFDWTAMAFDFGKSGRRALRTIAATGPVAQRPLATAALGAESRYSVENNTQTATTSATLDSRLILHPANRPLPAGARTALLRTETCRTGPCVIHWLSANRLIAVGRPNADSYVQSIEIKRNGDAWQEHYLGSGSSNDEDRTSAATADLATAQVEVRTVQRKQLYVNGHPVTDVFE